MLKPRYRSFFLSRSHYLYNKKNRNLNRQRLKEHLAKLNKLLLLFNGFLDIKFSFLRFGSNQTEQTNKNVQNKNLSETFSRMVYDGSFVC